MNLQEIIVSELGTPREPFGWDDSLLIIAVIAVVIGVEWLLGRAILRLASYIWKRIAAEYEKANRR